MTSRDERREASRQRLFAAALACLGELGYGATTTAAIARRAGLSNGALFHLYSSKDELILAAIGDLIRRIVTLDVARSAVPDTDRPVHDLVMRTTEVMRTPEALALLEFYAAARTRPALQRVIRTAESKVVAVMVDQMAGEFPSIASSPRLRGIVGLLVSSTIGATLIEQAVGGGYEVTATRESLVDAIEALIATEEQRAPRSENGG